MGEMSNIAESLRDVAEDMSLDPRIPRSVLRRARRRRGGTIVLAAVVTAGVVAGGFVGIRSLTGALESRPEPRPGNPAPTSRENRSAEALPRPVRETQNAILSAASDRDWDRLERLIPDRDFTYSIGDSIGGGAEAISFWRGLERAGDPVLATLVTLLEGHSARTFVGAGGVDYVYQWPAASAKPRREWTAKDVAQIRRIATGEELRQYRRHGYLGYRVGITADGTWLFYVAGD